MRIIQPINENWEFRKDIPCDNDENTDEGWLTVSLPHTYNAVDGQDGSPMYRGAAIYKKTISVIPEKGRFHYLEIGAAGLISQVLVNGTECASSSCGFSMYRAFIEPYLHEGSNEIVVNVTNAPTTKIYPAMADFSFYGGLYRGVSLITDDVLHFAETDLSRDGIILEPDAGDYRTGHLRVRAAVICESGQDDSSAAGRRAVCRVQVYNAAGTPVAEMSYAQEIADSADFDCALDIPDLHLWNGLQDPYLYTVKISLIGEDGAVYDERSLMCGFRTVAFDPARGMLLNGAPIKLNGVSRHQDFGGIGNAVTPETMKIDMELILEVGANSLRCSHYQHPDEWYDLCDRRGLLVWAEVPVISVIAQNPDADRNAFDQLDRLIAQARNHCCIYCWGVQNETNMGSNNAYTHDMIRRLALRAKELDPSRMTAQANEYTTEDDCPAVYYTDIHGRNLYYGWYYGEIPQLQERLDAIHKVHPAVPVILSEYGVDTNVKFHSASPKANDYSEEYQLKFLKNALDVIGERTFMAGGYIWNMFDFGACGRDEGGDKGKNQKGLVTIDRKIKKDAFYLCKAYWSSEPFVYIAGRRFKNRHQEQTDITILSNMESFRLTVNGAAAGECVSDGPMTVFKDIPLLPGENSVMVSALNTNGPTRTDRIVLCRVSEPDPSYIVKPKEKVVVDWFAGLDGEQFGIEEAPLRPEGFSFRDQMNDIYANDRAKGIFLKYLRPITLNARFEAMKDFSSAQTMIDQARRGIEIPEELLRHCEHELNRIDK